MTVLNIGFDVPFEEAIAAAKAKKIVLPGDYYDKLQGTARSMAFTVSGMTELDQLQLVLDSLNKTLENGTTFAQWKKTIPDSLFKLPKHRLDNIFRTNIQGAYAKGHWQQQIRHKRSRPYLMYSAINDSRVRPHHEAMDGVIAPVDDPGWDRWYPPSGYRCRCSVISLTERQAEKYYRQDTKKLRDDPALARERIKAEPDKGWDYHGGKDDSSQRLKAIEKKKIAKAPIAIQEEYNKRKQKYDKPKTLDDYIDAGDKLFNDLIDPKEPLNSSIKIIQALADQKIIGKLSAKLASKGKGAKLIARASDLYPDSWVAKSNKGKPLKTKFSNSRGYFSRRRADDMICAGVEHTAVHEYGHKLQHEIPELDAIFQKLHKRRTTGDELESLRSATGNRGYSWRERTRKDHYFDPYVGKEYNGSAREVLTMAFEAVLTYNHKHNHLVLLAEKDPELFKLALGLLFNFEAL